eukprot:140458-Pelagomonas_calceolata.AAC.4
MALLLTSAMRQSTDRTAMQKSNIPGGAREAHTPHIAPHPMRVTGSMHALHYPDATHNHKHILPATFSQNCPHSKQQTSCRSGWSVPGS